MASDRDGRSGCCARHASMSARKLFSTIIAKRSVFSSFAITLNYAILAELQTCKTCVSCAGREGADNTAHGPNHDARSDPCNRLHEAIAPGPTDGHRANSTILPLPPAATFCARRSAPLRSPACRGPRLRLHNAAGTRCLRNLRRRELPLSNIIGRPIRPRASAWTISGDRTLPRPARSPREAVKLARCTSPLAGNIRRARHMIARGKCSASSSDGCCGPPL